MGSLSCLFFIFLSYKVFSSAYTWEITISEKKETPSALKYILSLETAVIL